MKNRKKATFIVMYLIAFLILTGFSSMAMAVNCGGGFTDVGGVCVPTSTTTGGLSDRSIDQIITAFMRWLLYIFGFLAVIAFVVSGIQYITSAGDERQAETAKRNMIYSIIGVVVGLSGLIILVAVQRLLSGNSYF